ncbi:MAG: L-serine ammonia-lyase, iron-sulfur-dependent, subunit alpha [Planctomycetota bacterium]
MKIEVAPALGCTEPAAVALCTAAAGTLLKSKAIQSIEVWLSPSIYKNAFAVAIPGTKGQTGIDLAAGLGFYGGDPKLKLQVLASILPEHINTTRQLIQQKGIRINLTDKKEGIYIRSVIKAGDQTAEAIIEKTHDNLLSLKLNNRNVSDSPLLSDLLEARSDIDTLEEFLRSQSLEELLALVEQMDEDDFAFVREGIKYNLDLAKHGLAVGGGLDIGKTLSRLAKEGLLMEDMILSARIQTSAACDARMSGAKLPAMSSAGSGNHGLTAILPVWAVSQYRKDTEEIKLLKAIALSHIITGYIKSHTGRLSAVCGCSIAAGAGAAAGITCLMGGDLRQIAGAIKNLLSDLAGVICDGAKASCALKLATAAGTAVQSALFALHGINVKATDGIIACSPEQTTRNIGQISTEGMIDTDQTILKIMIDKDMNQKICSRCPKNQ